MNRSDESQAVVRHFLLFGVRILGVIFVMAGFLLIADRFSPLGGDADRWLGAALVIVGTIDFALLPRLLARHWKGTRAP